MAFLSLQEVVRCEEPTPESNDPSSFKPPGDVGGRDYGWVVGGHQDRAVGLRQLAQGGDNMSAGFLIQGCRWFIDDEQLRNPD